MGLCEIKALPLNRGKKLMNQLRSLLKSIFKETFVSLSEALKRSSMRFKNGLEIRTHLVTYRSLPRSDWSCFLVHSNLSTQDSHSDKISVILSGVMETVNSTVSISTARHVTFIAGWTTFFTLMSKPSSTNRAHKASNEALDLLTTECPIMSPI